MTDTSTSTTSSTTNSTSTTNSIRSYDAIIIGAGISGISAAYHFQKHCCPDNKTFRILERRQNLGGTWDLFSYPGIRSDSDMYTFGFSFRPWKESKVIAEKEDILKYLHETVAEYQLEEHMEFGVHIQNAKFDSEKAQWTLHTTTGNVEYKAQFIFLCVGYYSYDQPYIPDFPGRELFQGPIVHPQFWPKDLDYTDKNVVVIGSGATAITLIPAMTKTNQGGGSSSSSSSKGPAKHVTMLQRSPTYIVSKPAQMEIIPRVLAFCFGNGVARWFFVLRMMFQYYMCQWFPQRAIRFLLKMAKQEVGEDIYNDKDFTPRYKPWDQRLCLCPDGDFFQSLKSGKASIVTDHIVEFTKTGIRLQHDAVNKEKELPADIIVTATGLNAIFAGGIDISIDGQALDPARRFVYKGFMMNNTPNMFVAGGYTNASWTLKVDLTLDCACRLIQYMNQRQFRYCQPELPKTGDSKMEARPLLDLTSGYVVRKIDEFPKQSTMLPWRLYQNYIYDKFLLEYTPLDDGSMAFYK